MFGNNPVRKKETGDKYQVAEIFHTVQGEGPFSGVGATFVRLTGCNLQCDFCDTLWEDEGDPYLSITEVLAAINASGGADTQLVVLTGGEPSRWPLDPLIRALLGEKKHVQIETNGSFYHEAYQDPGVTIVCSPKTAGVHKETARVTQFWKYPLKAREMDWSDGLPKGLYRPDPTRGDITDMIFVTPCDEPNEFAANCAAVVKAAQDFGHIAQVQAHKILGAR